MHNLYSSHYASHAMQHQVAHHIKERQELLCHHNKKAEGFRNGKHAGILVGLAMAACGAPAIVFYGAVAAGALIGQAITDD